ncbi:glycosyltransferase family 4 protein [Polynucleobacter necessarius]|uniref:glycosyltransferase family 4 protein n=1 Tax=Polynucleobacter necessarius TaxID=576610 RepID=UPI000E08D66D|nr:glycosyltransferase family 4 protein [Polynucleobacter necessarius]
MKILVVSQYFWPEGFRINELIKSLVERGIEVDVLTGKPNYPDGDIFPGYKASGFLSESWNGATIFRVPLYPRGKNSSLKLALNYLSFIVSGVLFGPLLLRKRKYDVVFVYGLSPILLAIPAVFISWLKGKKLVIWVQDLWPQSLSATGYVQSRLILRCIEIIVRWIYRTSDLILVQSHAFEGAVAELALGKEIIYYPNSVDSSFAQTPVFGGGWQKIESLETGFPVIFAGNVGAAQAVETIVEAAVLLKEVPEIRFVIFGTGSKWEWLKNKVTDLGLSNLYLPGRFPVEAMPGYLQKAEVLLVTLTNEPIFALTVPNKIQAYMASGKPIVASLNGEGAKIVVESGSGISTPAEDPVVLAGAILSLYRMSAQERKQIGENGRVYYQAHFDHDILVDQLINHLEIISTKKGKLST